jgi:hypothetical protein
MCGIAGYHCISPEFDRRFSVALPILALAMRERGKHSWGVTNSVDVTKFNGDIALTFERPYDGERTVLLHTRFATFGAKIAENSHPFRIGKILGVHNGMIFNHAEVAKEYGYKYEVDSEVLFHHLNEGRSLKELEGYGAVVFFQDGNIHIGKFNNGSMTLVRLKTGWMWASTIEAVNHAVQMAGFSKEVEGWYDLKDGRLFYIKEDTLYYDDRELNLSGHIAAYPVYTPWQGRFKEDTSKYPSSDKDEVVDVSEADEANFHADLIDKAIEKLSKQVGDNACFFCEEELDGDSPYTYDNYAICEACYDQALDEDADEFKSGLFDGGLYKFRKMSVEDLISYHGARYSQCEDCLTWALQAQSMYLGTIPSPSKGEDSNFVVCCGCYEKNYASTLRDIREDADAAFAEAVVQGA